MSISEYLESSSFFDIVKYGDHSALDAIAFLGTLRKHPYDQEKCLLLSAGSDPSRWADEGTIIEFRISDVVGADEMPSPVDETGTARSLVRLWVRRGAIALRYEPFEVGDKPLGPRDSALLRNRLSQMAHSHHMDIR